MMVQDWGGPIGFSVATRHPDRFSTFVIGNTWGWPKSDPGTQVFSRLLGGPIGRYLILRKNFFVERIIPSGRAAEAAPRHGHGRLPRPLPDARVTPTGARLPGEILRSRPLLAEIEQRLPSLAERPALVVWPTKDFAFRAAARRRWEELFPEHRTVLLEGAGHYIQEDAPEEIVSSIREWSEVRRVEV